MLEAAAYYTYSFQLAACAVMADSGGRPRADLSYASD